MEQTTPEANAMPTVILACQVMADLFAGREDRADRVIYMNYGLHVRPKAMTPALQKQLDRLEDPSLVIIGYGLCGNGTAGLEAGRHTLVIPKAADCITMLLGSQEAYLQEFQNNPGTYYLTKGWLESHSDPLGEYETLLDRFGERKANIVIEAMYSHYKTLCLVAHSKADLAAQRKRALEVAAFCKERWGMAYKEKVGKSGLVDRLLKATDRGAMLGDEFLVIPPGDVITAEMFK